MVFYIQFFAVFCLLAQLLNVDSRVIDNDEQDIFKGQGEVDGPYGYFEEEDEEEEEPMMADQPAARSVQQHLPAERPYRTCSGPADCYQDECCHIGMQRYSEPSCRSLGNVGDFCRMEPEPVNRTLYYPNGISKEVNHGYILFCPCMEGLTCLRALCRPNRELYLMDGADPNIL